jgi:hypothetical protein
MKRHQAEREHFVRTIIEASEILSRIGWSVAIPQTEEIDHLMVGEKEKLVELAEVSEREYELMTKEDN